MYEGRILEMVKANRQSLDVDFVQLSRHTTALAIWTVDAPQQMLKLFNEAAEALVDRRYKNYRANVHQNIYVRMTGLPVVENLRDIRCAPAPCPHACSMPACMQRARSAATPRSRAAAWGRHGGHTVPAAALRLSLPSVTGRHRIAAAHVPPGVYGRTGMHACMYDCIAVSATTLTPPTTRTD